ncbi:putative transcriptional regulatory protein NarL [compost metagenome]
MTPHRPAPRNDFAHTFPAPRNDLEHSIYHWMSLMAELTDRITACDDLEQAQNLMVKQLGALLGADRCVLILQEGKDPPIISHEYRASPSHPAILGMRLTPSPLFEKVVQSKDPVAIVNFPASGTKSLEIVDKGLIKSTLIGCLRFQDRILGILSIQDCTSEREWSAEEIGIVKWFCTTVSMYISCMRMQETMKNLSEHFMAGLKELTTANARQGLSPGSFVRKIRTQTRALDEGVLAPYFPNLTNRERQVLMRLEMPNKSIAQELFTSPHTIKGHVNRLFRKLGVNTRDEAISRMREALGQALEARS